jgi:hypothetical protein
MHPDGQVRSNMLFSKALRSFTCFVVFKNLYMSNGTLFIITENSSDFPDILLMTSTGLSAENTPENIAARKPTPYDMDFVTAAEARRRWGADVRQGRRNRVLSVDGNTVRINLLNLPTSG